MTSWRTLAVVVSALILTVSAVALAQPNAAPAAPPAAPAVKPAPVLDVIPAGSFGFVFTPSVSRTFGAVQQYLKNIGLEGAIVPADADLLDMMKGALKLGEGFNPEGGAAAVLLDPAPFGMDFAKLIQDSKSGTRPAEKIKVPFVLLLPCNGLKETFGKYEMKEEEGLTLIQLRMGEMYAGLCKGYAVLSPNAKAVQAVMKAEKAASSELPKNLLEAYAAADVSVYANLKAAGPTLQAFLKLAMEEAKNKPHPEDMPIAPEQIIGMFSTGLSQIRSISFTAQFGKAGFVFQEFVTAEPNSLMSAAIAAVKPGVSAALDRLPSLPYALALSALAGPKNSQDKEMRDQALNLLLPVLGVSKEEASKMSKLCQDFGEQVTGAQIVVGGAPEGAGTFGVDIVLACKDSAKLKGLMPEVADSVKNLIDALAKKGGAKGDSAKVKVIYTKDAEKAGDLSLDTIEIAPPDTEQVNDDEKKVMKNFLGEDRIRLFIGAPDEKTVIITFGGTAAMATEAAKAAKGGGVIPKDEGVLAAMKFMPANPQMLLMINGANGLAVFQKAIKALGMPPTSEAVKITAKTSLAIGASAANDTAHVVIFIPNDLAKDVATMILMLADTESATPPPAPKARSGESF